MTKVQSLDIDNLDLHPGARDVLEDIRRVLNEGKYQTNLDTVDPTEVTAVGESKITNDGTDFQIWFYFGETDGWKAAALGSAIGSPGDVVGPASATDNAISRYNGTTGKIIQNSSVIIDDSNNITGVVNFTVTGNIALGSGGTVDGFDVSTLATTSTDNAIARFNGTSGGTQNSIPTINDSGDLNMVSHDITSANYVKSIRTITNADSPYTALVTDEYILVDASSGAVTVALFAVSGNTGRELTIKKIDSSGNAVTVDGNSAETIDDATTKVIGIQYDAMKIVNNGSAWFIV